jgi:hypothetical protein
MNGNIEPPRRQGAKRTRTLNEEQIQPAFRQSRTTMKLTGFIIEMCFLGVLASWRLILN